jgi:protein TonB
MVYALALSLALHIGAGLAFIIAGSCSSIGTNHINTFTIQDVALAPSIGMPEKKTAARPDQPAAMTSTTATAALERGEPEHEQAPARPSEPSGSQEKQDEKASSSLGLGMANGYFTGLADGRSLRDDIRGYYLEMVERINREWWDKAGLLKEPLRQDGIFELLIQREGTVVSIRIVQGTGSAEADQLLTEIIRKASPLPPLPPTYNLSQFLAPLRIKAPLFLFRLKN